MDLSAGIFTEIIRRMEERHAMEGDRHFLEEELKFVYHGEALTTTRDAWKRKSTLYMCAVGC